MNPTILLIKHSVNSLRYCSDTFLDEKPRCKCVDCADKADIYVLVDKQKVAYCEDCAWYLYCDRYHAG